jgi:hypothetical protein
MFAWLSETLADIRFDLAIQHQRFDRFAPPPAQSARYGDYRQLPNP